MRPIGGIGKIGVPALIRVDFQYSGKRAGRARGMTTRRWRRAGRPWQAGMGNGRGDAEPHLLKKSASPRRASDYGRTVRERPAARSALPRSIEAANSGVISIWSSSHCSSHSVTPRIFHREPCDCGFDFCDRTHARHFSFWHYRLQGSSKPRVCGPQKLVQFQPNRYRR